MFRRYQEQKQEVVHYIEKDINGGSKGETGNKNRQTYTIWTHLKQTKNRQYETRETPKKKQNKNRDIKPQTEIKNF